MDLHWEDGFTISVSVEGGAVTLRANREGLRSLAGYFEALANERPGSHVHLDEFNSLESGSAEMIVELAE